MMCLGIKINAENIYQALHGTEWLSSENKPPKFSVLLGKLKVTWKNTQKKEVDI